MAVMSAAMSHSIIFRDKICFVIALLLNRQRIDIGTQCYYPIGFPGAFQDPDTPGFKRPVNLERQLLQLLDNKICCIELLVA